MKKIFKHILSGIMLITILVTVMAVVNVSAATIVQMGTAGDDIAWVLWDDGKLTLQGDGKIPNYGYTKPTYITVAKEHNIAITEVEILNGVTYIGNDAFRDLDQLTKISMADSVTSTGTNIFRNCSALTDVTLSSNLTELDNYFFGECTSLEKLTIPVSVKTINHNAFYGCAALKNVSVDSENATFKIENGALTNVSGTNLVWAGGITDEYYFVPPTVTLIANNAFTVSTETKIVIPETVTTIEENAIVADVTIYAKQGGVVQATLINRGISPQVYNDFIGDTAFYRVIAINGDTKNRLMNVFGYGAINDYSNFTEYPPYYDQIDKIRSVFVNNGITYIGQNFMSNAINLESLTLPDTVTEIGREAFRDCISLTSLKFPANLEAIGHGAFWGTGFTSLNFKSPLKSISAYAFADCINLASVSFPETLKWMSDNSFSNTALTTVTIPASCNTVTVASFENCMNLKEIKVKAGNKDYVSVDGVLYTADMKNLRFYPPAKEDEIYLIPDGVEELTSTFSSGTPLKSIYIPESVTFISSNRFTDGSVTFWCTSTSTAYEYASNLKIPVKLTNGKDANESIDWYFEPHSGTLTLSGTGALADNPVRSTFDLWYERVEHAVIEEGITYIGSGVIWDYPIVETITLPLSVTKIQLNGINNNKKLTDIYYAGAVDDWNNIRIDRNNNLNGATIHYGIVQSIRYALASSGNIIVATTNIRDGKQVMVAAYDNDGRFISLHYVPIISNMGELNNVSTEGWATVRAFMVNLETLVPASNAVEGNVN